MKFLQNYRNLLFHHRSSNSNLICGTKNNYLTTLNLLLAFITIILQLYIIISLEHISLTYIAISSIITLFFCFICFLSSILQSKKLQDATQDLEDTKLYNKSLKIGHDDLRAFKHDFSNIIQAIGGYITNDDMKGLKIYYYQLFGDCQKLNTLYSLNSDFINNPAIHSILSSKYHKAVELGITINFDILLHLEELNMKIYEFSRILGILMDNAIEAASECEEKVIHVEIRKDTKRNRQLVIIENTYFEKNIDIERIFQKGYSSKSHNTGLGLWEVRQILKKNKNLNLYTTQDGYFFRQQLEVYEKTSKKPHFLAKTKTTQDDVHGFSYK